MAYEYKQFIPYNFEIQNFWYYVHLIVTNCVKKVDLEGQHFLACLVLGFKISKSGSESIGIQYTQTN